MPGKRSNNDHKYPQANHQPRHKAAERMGRAQAREEANALLTLEQKIAKLPPEPASAKERARLLDALAKRNAPKPINAQTQDDSQKSEVSESKQNNNKKSYMRGFKNEVV